MKRVSIVGNGGAGKSTLGLALGASQGLPVFHLDKLIWKPNWEPVPEPEFSVKHDEILSKEKWIIEGLGYNSTLDRRFESSDTIIYIDFSVAVHIGWAIKRSVKSIVTKPKGWADGCQLITRLPKILRIIWLVDRHTKPYILSLIARYESFKTIYHLRTPRRLKQFYQFAIE